MKPQPILCDMPPHIKENIVLHVDAFTKMTSLHRICKEYKFLVDKAPVEFYKIRVCYIRHAVAISLYSSENDHKTIIFEKYYEGYITTKNPGARRETVFVGDYVNAALDLLMKTVSVSNVFFENLDVTFNWNFHELLVEKLSILEYKLRVKNLNLTGIKAQNQLESIIPFLEPGTLKSISITHLFLRGGLFFNRVALLEQWKQAETFKTFNFELYSPYSEWCHFKDCDVGLEELPLEHLKEIVDNFKQNSSLRSTIITLRQEIDDEVRSYLNDFKVADQENNWCIPIRENDNLDIILDGRIMEENKIKIVRRLTL